MTSIGLSDGNVGIGTTTPQAALSIVGNIQSPSFVGMVCHFAMATAPVGWLKCNGQAVSRTTYAALFAALGTLYGVGDGSTTFNLPDLRGEFVRGWDDSRGVDTGRVIGAGQTDALQNITGSMGQIVHYSISTSGALSYVNQASSIINPGAGGYYGWGTLNFNASSVARTAAETRPRNVALLACIKF